MCFTRFLSMFTRICIIFEQQEHHTAWVLGIFGRFYTDGAHRLGFDYSWSFLFQHGFICVISLQMHYFFLVHSSNIVL